MKKLYIISLISGILAVASCNRFDDYNTNPDKNTVVTPEMLATGAMLSTFKAGGDAKAYISYSALPKYVVYITEGPMGAQYNSIGSCYYGSYQNLPNLAQMVEYAAGGDYEDSFKGLALFIKAYNGYRLTTQTGDIPYSEAGLGKSGLVTPKYDAQEDVFKAVLEDLKAAEAHFAAGKDFSGDIIYGGSVEKWRRAANSLQLKALMTLSNKITEEQKSRFAEIVAAGNLLRDNGDNLKLVYTATSGTWHPLYNQTMFDPYTTISTVVADELKKLNDRRLFYFAEPAPAQLGDYDESDFEAYAGADPSKAWDALNLDMQAGKYSPINLRYMNEQAGDPYVQLSYAEQSLIIAEAIELGWMTGTSKDYYENGVKAGLAMVAAFDTEDAYNNGMPITEAYINGYFTGEAAYKPASADRLKQIWFQRYFLKFLQDGYDAYYDFLRTGYPEFPLDPATNLNTSDTSKFPVRWTYPSGEIQTNTDNLNAALARQFPNGHDGVNEVPWLLE